MSVTLQHLKQTENRFVTSLYSALNTAWVISFVVVLLLLLFFVSVQR